MLEGKNNIFNHDLLKDLSFKHNKSVAKIVLRWLIQRDIPAIPKSANIKRMNENFNVFDFELSGDDMETVKSLDKGSGLIIMFNKRLKIRLQQLPT